MAVMGVAMIVALVAMAGIHLARVETDVLIGAEHVAHAELLSQSAAEFAIARLLMDSGWRTTYTSGVDAPSATGTTLGTGNIKFQLIDADGNLNDDDRDMVKVRGIGRVGKATQVTTVELEPTNTPLSCLDVALHAGGSLLVQSGTTTTDRKVSSNGSIVSTGTIVGDAWAVGSFIGVISGGAATAGATPARKMPEATTMWDYYLANGTRIDINSLPSQRMDRILLSAAINPYGATNSQGIYIVDTGGQTLRIRDSRLLATLVVIGPVKLESQLNWAPPAANYPALLVQGNLTMDWSGGSPLVESTAGVNFNPAGTPYEEAFDANVLDDSYPGIIKGIVYCSGALSVTSACVMQGSLIAGSTATLQASTTIAYNPAPYSYPPPGFASGNTMRVVPRTWRRAAK